MLGRQESPGCNILIFIFENAKAGMLVYLFASGQWRGGAECLSKDLVNFLDQKSGSLDDSVTLCQTRIWKVVNGRKIWDNGLLSSCSWWVVLEMESGAQGLVQEGWDGRRYPYLHG